MSARLALLSTALAAGRLTFDVDFYLSLLRFFGLGEPNFEDAVFKRRVGLLRIDFRRERDAADESAVDALGAVVVGFVRLFFFLLFAAQHEHVVRNCYIDVILVDAGYLGLNDDIIA